MYIMDDEEARARTEEPYEEEDDDRTACVLPRGSIDSPRVHRQCVVVVPTPILVRKPEPVARHRNR